MDLTSFSEAVNKIKKGGVGIIPTDTMYGIVASATIPFAVEKIYELRHRDTNKKCIVLISSLDDLKIFGTKLEENTKKILSELWPGPFSIDLSINEKNFYHLTRGADASVAFRLPNDENLRDFIKQAGPIIAPSANTEGNLPSKDINEARGYFPNLDFYVDGGSIDKPPSTVIQIVDSKVKILRQGQGIVSKKIVL